MPNLGFPATSSRHEVIRVLSEQFATAQRNLERPVVDLLDALRQQTGGGPVLLLALGGDDADLPAAAGVSVEVSERWKEVASRLADRITSQGLTAADPLEDEEFRRFAEQEVASLRIGPCRVVGLPWEGALVGALFYPASSTEFAALADAVAGSFAALLLTRRELRQMRARLARSQVETAILLDLSRGITSTLNLQEALGSLALVMKQLLSPVDKVRIRLRDANGNYSLVAPTDSGEAEIGLLPPDHPLDRMLSEAGRPFLIVEDLPAISHRDVFVDSLLREGMRSALIAPIRGKDRNLGYLAALSMSPRRFAEFDGDLAAALAGHAATAIENSARFAHAGEQIQRRNAEITQLADSLQQRVIELSILNELGVMVNSVLDVRQVLDLIVKSAVDISGAESASLFLREGRSARFSVQSSRGLSDEFLKKVSSLSSERGLVAEIVRTKKPLVVQALDQESRFRYPEIVDEGIQSVLGVPLLAEDAVNGILFVSNRRPVSFTEDDQRLFSLLASQAAVALRNARLFEEMQRRVTELTTLHDLGLAVNSVLDLKSVLDMVVRSATEITDSRSSSIFLYDKTRDEFRVGAAVGLDEDFLEQARVTDRQTLTRLVLKEGQPIAISDLDRDARFTTDLVRSRGIKSQICFPLKAEEVIGVFYVNNFEPHEYSDDEMRLFSILANQATIAIKNARLFQGLQQRVSELSAMYDVAQAVSTSADLRMVLSATVLKLSVLLAVQRCRILLWDEESRELVPQEVTGSWEPPARERGAISDSAALATHVFKGGETFVSNDAENDPRILERFVDVLGIRTLVVAPLKVGNRSIGVIELANKQEGETFTEEDLKLLSTLASQAAAAIQNARLYQDLRGSYLLTIRSLAEALDSRDTYTRGHSDRVSKVSLAIARSLGLSDGDVEQAMLAGVLHDIGKIGVREAVLLKPGKLTDDEFDEIKKHPIIGARILRPIPAMQPLVPLVLHHHERFDGKGYPSGLLGRDTPIGSSIIGVADAYDTMTSDRPYRKALPIERAMEEIHRCAGTQFRPEAVEALDKAMRQPDWPR